jgi:hypothetical protein
VSELHDAPAAWKSSSAVSYDEPHVSTVKVPLPGASTANQTSAAPPDAQVHAGLPGVAAAVEIEIRCQARFFNFAPVAPAAPKAPARAKRALRSYGGEVEKTCLAPYFNLRVGETGRLCLR